MNPVIGQIVALLAVMMPAISASAYDFELDDICYDITSEENRTVSVTRYSSGLSENSSYYTGAISIPEKLTYSNNTYTVTSIGSSAFYGCKNITSVEIPNSVTSLEYRAFGSCSNLTSIDLPNSVTTVGDGAFTGCMGLTSIEIPSSVIEIGKSAFYFCSSLTSIEIPTSVIEIKESTFYCCSSLTSVEIPNSVLSIGKYAFESCRGLTSINIPSSVTMLYPSSFNGCTALSSISVSDNNEKYASVDGVLYDKKISKLLVYPAGRASDKTISLPATLTSIDNDVLNIFTELTAIYMHGDTPPIYNSVFSANTLKNTVLYVPNGSLTAYKNAEPWKNFVNIEEMDYSGIEDVTNVVDDIEITIVNGAITVNGGNDALMINVYDISGKLIYSGNDNVVEGLNHGMYIVRIGNTVRKVVI